VYVVCVHIALVSSHESIVQSVVSLQSRMPAEMHVPLTHDSTPLQNTWSSQLVSNSQGTPVWQPRIEQCRPLPQLASFVRCTHMSIAPSHESSVHETASLHVGTFAATQRPLMHCSTPLQKM